MDTVKMAEFLTALRKEKKLTQKELAQQLGVTDKAVSKWERGHSCPDISLLARLSEILGVSASELLSGERKTETAPEVEAIVETTLRYAGKTTKSRSNKVRAVLGVLMTGSFLLAAMVCFICNIAISHTISWAWFPFSSLLFSWLILMPLIVLKKKRIIAMLASFSIFIIPFLYSLEKIGGWEGEFMPIALPVTVVTVIYLWISYLLLSSGKIPALISLGIIVLLAIPLSWGVQAIVDVRLTGHILFEVWDLISYGSTFLIGGILVCIGLLAKVFGKDRSN